MPHVAAKFAVVTGASSGVGQAIAINSKGKSKVISLDDIYESAKGMGQIMTEAVY